MMQEQETQAQATTTDAPKRRWMHRHPRLTLVLVNLVGLLFLSLIAEVSLRAWGMHPGTLDMGWINFDPLPADSTLRTSHEFYTDSLGIFKACAEHATGYRVNADGFRGPELMPQDSSRKKVMLIGDSFTWGARAEPLDSSYADLLRRPDWQVMNFGIPGADPDQYARVAEWYIPRMQPDLVCLFFYMANDKMDLDQHVGPYQNRYHLTNAGWLNAFMDGEYLGDAQATYDYCVQKLMIPKTTFFNRACAQTVLSTLVWRAMLRMGWIDAHYPESVQKRLANSQKMREAGPYSRGYLEQVQAICSTRNIPLLLFVIPTHTQIQFPTDEERKKLFPDMEIYCPTDLVIEDYHPRPDGHYNNSGHRKMAAFVAAEIEKTMAR